MATKPIKVYVRLLQSSTLTRLIPTVITWEDGNKYEIDRVMDICQRAAMKAGGQGDRYTIMINGHQSYLFSSGMPR